MLQSVAECCSEQPAARVVLGNCSAGVVVAECFTVLHNVAQCCISGEVCCRVLQSIAQCCSESVVARTVLQSVAECGGVL